MCFLVLRSLQLRVELSSVYCVYDVFDWLTNKGDASVQAQQLRTKKTPSQCQLVCPKGGSFPQKGRRVRLLRRRGTVDNTRYSLYRRLPLQRKQSNCFKL